MDTSTHNGGQDRGPAPAQEELSQRDHGLHELGWARVDHKRIGIMYLVGVLTAFLMGGMLRAAGPADAADAHAHALRQQGRC